MGGKKWIHAWLKFRFLSIRLVALPKIRNPDRPTILQIAREKRDGFIDFPGALARNIMEYESDGDASCHWYTCNNPQRIGKGTKRLRTQRTSRYHLDYSITKIGLNTEKSPGDLWRFAVTQTSVKNH